MTTVTRQVEIDLELMSQPVDLDLSPGASLIRTNVITVDVSRAEEGVSFDGTTAVTILATWTATVATNVIANAIYDRFGPRIRRMTVDRRRVAPTREDLVAALEEALRLAAALEDDAQVVPKPELSPSSPEDHRDR